MKLIVIFILITTNVVSTQDDDSDDDEDLTMEQLLKSALAKLAGKLDITAPNNCGMSSFVNGNEDFEGNNSITDFPWLGVLYYSNYGDTRRFTTPVILVTKQFAIGSATEIDRLPKTDFRARARVVFGDICTKEGAPIKDYTYHPEFGSFQNAIGLIHLQNGFYMHSLTPICAPPLALRTSDFYAVTITKGCAKGYITFHKVNQADEMTCSQTRRSDADSGLWPLSATCTQPNTRRDYEECTWTSGVPLMGYQDGRWRLFGFGTFGQGCNEPSRFLDFGVYSKWIRRSSKMIGLPAISTMGRDNIVMRMVPSHVRRYGPCDPEEVKHEIYTDRVHLQMDPPLKLRKVTYNVTLLYGKEYACMVFKVYHNRLIAPKLEQRIRPRVELKQFAVSDVDNHMCRRFSVKQFEFEVSIYFSNEAYFELYVYGRDARDTDHGNMMEKRNNRVLKPFIPKWQKIKQIIWNRFEEGYPGKGGKGNPG